MIQTVIKIDGMMCSMCENHICDCIRKLDVKLNKVTASHKKGEAVVLSDTELPRDQLEKLIGDTGYRVLGIESAPAEKKKHFWQR